MRIICSNFFIGIFLICTLCISLPVDAQRETVLKTIVAQDVLSSAVPSSVKIEGMIGQKLNSCIENGVMAKNYELYTLPFKEKSDDGGGFTGEFWGKWFTSAALGYGYQPTAAHKAILDKSVSELLKAQDADGRLSSYSRANDFGYWDIWGRKYALLGLIAHYDQTGDKESLKSACRATDAIIEIAGPGKKKLTETGLRIIGSLSSCSLLEPVVQVYERSGNKKYLDFARYLVQLWSEPNDYNPKGLRLIEDAMAGVDPVLIAAPKGYEMMSCYEGLCELYRVTGEQRLLDAVVKFGKSVLKKEIMIVGSGSSGELWCDGANRQTEILEQPMETCVTVTWMKLCYQLLQLTGDPVWADQLEVSLYNALFGAICDDGNWWAYFSPLIGERMPSPMQVPVCHSSCCVANGPRGMLITPGWSVMKSKSGPVINLYSKGTWTQKLKNGTELKITQETNYPEEKEILIHIDLPKPERFTVSLRIPAWDKNTRLMVNDKTISCSAGTYATITREWKQGDKIRLEMDLRGRIIRAPGSVNDLAVMRGPIVLALDNRMVKAENFNLWLLPDGTKWNYQNELGGLRYVLPKPCPSADSPEQYIELTPVANKPADVWMAFEVPFLYRYTHFFDHKQVNLIMCDYASAGNKYDEKNLFRVWLPQPLFMNDIFPENTWRILYREGDTRPVIPYPVDVQSQAPKISSDYWTATDALGRKTPDAREVGPRRKDKFVGIFYSTWHTDFQADFSPVMNIREILQRYPEAALRADHPAWKGIDGGVFWWDEPLFGYYRTTDEWVLRKHAELLADAGIDAVFLDCTNGTLTWKSSYMKLLKVWDQARKDGVNTPRIVFILPFAPNDNGLASIKELYNDLYKPGLYKDLWFNWKGKPLILSYFEMLADVPGDPDETRLRREIRDFFTFRPPQPDYVNGPSRNDQWGWLENYPQHGYVKKQDGGFEEVTVGVAQNARDSSGGHWTAFNAPGTYGRSYTKTNGQDTRSDAYLYGLNFQEQWNRAFELDPDFIFITGWNEWTAGRWLHLELPTSPPYKPFGFIDQYTAEKSRDIEPVKSWGNRGDVYYLQMIDNIRRFKGMEEQDAPSVPKSFIIGNFEGWQDVKPAFRSYKGNTLARNHKGQGDSLVYVNQSGRNDIVLAKVARDKEYVYFYVKTAGNLSSRNDPGWMRLFIDIDRNKNSGWEGYDFVINRMSPGKSAVVEKSTNGWNWEKAGLADYSIKNNAMELRVKRALFGSSGKKLDFEFKWSDNMQEDGNIMDFYINGDAVPGGRFNYVYTTK